MKLSKPQLVTAIVMHKRDKRKQASNVVDITKWSTDVEAVNAELKGAEPPIESLEDYKQYCAWKRFSFKFYDLFQLPPSFTNWKDHGIKYWDRENKNLYK
jgi:hypothetical protein